MANQPDLQFDINVKATGLSALEGTKRAIESVEHKMKSGQRAVNRFADANDNAAKVQGRAMNALQQAGFQVGDFAVQVAGGTSAVQAFGQQGSQLLGIFGPIGAVLGAVVAVVSALGVAMQRSAASTSASTVETIMFADALRDVTRAYDELAGARDTFLNDPLFRAVKEQEGVVKTLNDAIAAQQERLEKTLSQRGNDMFGVRDALPEGIRNQIAAMTEQLAIEEGKLADFKRKTLELDRASYKSLRQRTEVMRQMGQLGQMTEGQKKAQETIASMVEQERLMRLQLRHGRDSLEVTNERRRAEAQALVDRLRAQGATTDQINQAAQALHRQHMLQDQITAATEQTNVAVARFPKIVAANVEQVTPQMQEIIDRSKAAATAVSGSFETAFMGIVDGTATVKDAFRSLASDIIRELYRIFVVKQITGMIASAIVDPAMFGGVGDTSPISSVRPAARSFSGGGYTGDGARAGGLDGKGGFMAMIHPRETVIDHTKSQSAGITVVQHNTFGQGVSRQEVQQMLPSIVEATKAAVFDAQRRSVGGRGYA